MEPCDTLVGLFRPACAEHLVAQLRPLACRPRR